MSSELPQYINIHTHNPNTDDNSYNIINQIIGYDKEVLNKKAISVGIHPWYINYQEVNNYKKKLLEAAKHNHVFAIGECGLDKVCNSPWDLQLAVFNYQIQLANSLNKPLIIHCVKAFAEVQALLNDAKNKVPVLFHGFSKSKEMAISLTQKGYYLSFGEALKHDKNQEVLRSIPLNKVFLETDHAGIHIKDVYDLAQQALNIPIENIQSQIWQNLKDIY